MQAVLEKARKIRVVIFDVDGVLTDGSLYFAAGGEEIKTFNSHDGHGMKTFKASGVSLPSSLAENRAALHCGRKIWTSHSSIRGAKKSCRYSRGYW